MSNKIKELRKARHMTQTELGDILGVGKSAISKYEKGRVENLKRSTIAEMAKLFSVSPSYLLGWEDVPSGFDPLPQMRTVPVIGEIACGVPALAEQNHIGSAAVPEGVLRQGSEGVGIAEY